MRLLYHVPLSPFSRKVRVMMAEKKIDFKCIDEPVWQRREAFLRLNPACEVPVLVEIEGQPLSDDQAICEYLEERYPDDPLLGVGLEQRAEVRRLCAWFDKKFNYEVTELLVGEKIFKRIYAQGTPDSAAIRAGKSNIRYHLDYISFLHEKRKWLAGNDMSLADIAAAAHLSCVDYLGDVPWDDFPSAKDWYARIKSRPSMRQLLTDRLPGHQPAPHYTDLDF